VYGDPREPGREARPARELLEVRVGAHVSLLLDGGEKRDLVEYLKSLPD
jgi:hypothetical protein